MIDSKRLSIAFSATMVAFLLGIGCGSQNPTARNSDRRGPSRVKSSKAPADLHRIANDVSAAREKRAEAVFSLFANHLKLPQGAAEVAKLLTGEKWLKDTKLIGFYVYSLVPVRCRFDQDTVFCLHLFPEKTGRDNWVIYFTLSGGSERPEREARAFLQGAHDIGGDPKLIAFTLCFPPSEKKPLGRIECFGENGISVLDP